MAKIIDAVEKKVVEWLFGKALKKAVVRVVTLFVAWVMGLGLQQYGLDIDTEKLTAACYMGLEIARNWVKIKFPAIGKYL
jgi:hypothetical protein